MLSISLAIALLAPLALAGNSIKDHKNDIYLSNMCYPRIRARESGSSSNPISAMSHSPFPCEQSSYLSRSCFSNGTTEIDFLAEQQCLCGGNFFEAVRGCHECYFAHGFVDPEYTRDEVMSRLSSANSAECSATPITMPYTNLFPPPVTTLSDATIVSDRFPNDTAVSNYWTGATAPVAGQITGSATARLSSFTNTGQARYTPTGTTEGGSGGDGGASSTDAPAPSSTNGAAKMKVAGGLLAVVIGAMAAL